MTARIAPEGAGRYDHLHGDEDMAPELSPAEQDAIEKLAEEIIEERLAHGDIAELFDGLDYKAWVPEIQRACRNIKNSVSSIISIQRTLQIEARRVWGDEARKQAEKEICGDI